MMQYTQPTLIIDSDNSIVLKFAQENAGSTTDHIEQSISLYYAVRDSIRYDPYKYNLSAEGLKSSTTLQDGHGWCVSKAILLASCCRAIGIPSRLGFADVRNHLTTERMRKQMTDDVFYWHGYTSIYLNKIWVKATPAFNIELCEKFRLKTLDFDGLRDSIYHPFDLDGKKHMEYIRHRGEYQDVPLEKMEEDFKKLYSLDLTSNEADFDHDVEQEILEN